MDQQPPAKSPLGFIKPRDTARVVAMASTYSQLVAMLRWILPIAVLIVLAILVVWPMMSAQKMKTTITADIPNLVVENLKLSGIDKDSQPYALTARKALQVQSQKDTFDLENPQGELTLNSGAWLSGRAERGRYDQANKRLWLGGAVELFHDQGYNFATSEAQFDLSKNNAWGEQPVEIHGPFGEIHGNGFKLLEGGKVMIVTGHATAKLSLHSSTASGSNEP